MESEGLVDLPSSGDSGSGIDSKDTEVDALAEKVDLENLPNSENGAENIDNQVIEEFENIGKDLSQNSFNMETSSISFTETETVEEMSNGLRSIVAPENGHVDAPEEFLNVKINIDEARISGVKRDRMTFEEHKPLVRVVYNSLTRESKRKLEELLQKWSEWDAQHCSSTRNYYAQLLHGQTEVLESGEDTYYPALYVGLDKTSAVSFWMDNQTRNQRIEAPVSMDCNSVPHYDRSYALGLTSIDGSNNPEGGLEVDASRCFNCGSYNHSLKECPKPRNNAAVNSARKLQQSKRNLNPGSRNPTRYYENSSGGKYDGLMPGALHAETRQLLGLKDHDPPPWLNRMREIGYPPGYLDQEDVDEPSGITIFGDEEDNNNKKKKADQEDGEILDINYHPEPKKNMSVAFPGINAPIPDYADDRRWLVGDSNSEQHLNRPHRRSNHSLDNYNRDHYREERWSQDDGPPGVGPSSSYPPNYGKYDFNYNYHSSRSSNVQAPRSPIFGRSSSERSRSISEREPSPPSHSSYHSSFYSSYSKERHSNHTYHDRR